MSDRHATRRRVLLYLIWFGTDAPLNLVAEHMQARYGIDPHATRQMIWRLVHEGRVTRTQRGYYRVDVTATGLDTQSPPLTTQRSEYYTEG